MNENLILTIFEILLLTAQIILLIYKPKGIYVILFISTLLVLSGFYLLRNGMLEKFSFETFSTKAEFINQAESKVRKDVEGIAVLKKKNEEVALKIANILDQIQLSQKEIEEYKSEVIKNRDELVRMKLNVVEISMLQSVGAYQYPNPFLKRITEKLNEIISIAIPDSKIRNDYLFEFNQYIRSEQQQHKPAAEIVREVATVGAQKE